MNIEFDTITVFENGITREIFPLVTVNQNQKKFLFYLDKIKNKFSIDDVFIGEITSKNEIIPIDSKILDNFEQLLGELILKY